jgi:Domain of unknown function (DUF397)
MQAADDIPGWWRKSSFSGYNTNCVEVGHSDGIIAVRDTKERQGGALRFTTAQWDAFLGDVRGEFTREAGNR